MNSRHQVQGSSTSGNQATNPSSNSRHSVSSVRAELLGSQGYLASIASQAQNSTTSPTNIIRTGSIVQSVGRGGQNASAVDQLHRPQPSTVGGIQLSALAQAGAQSLSATQPAEVLRAALEDQAAQRLAATNNASGNAMAGTLNGQQVRMVNPTSHVRSNLVGRPNASPAPIGTTQLQILQPQTIDLHQQSAYAALMNQIGGLTQAAAYAQAHAQARAIREGILNANTVALQQHLTAAAAEQFNAAQQRAQQMVGRIQINVNHGAAGALQRGDPRAAAYHQYGRQLVGNYGSEADDSGDLDSDALGSESELPGKHMKNGQYTSEEDEFEFPRVIPIRASTAPPRPLTEIEEFRRSPEFMLLENTVMTSDHLKQRADEKYDLDSEDGQRACKRFLNQIERLCERFKALCASRKYREQFSKAYKVLYKEGSLCYLTEILDSAQEGFPYLWVNGEKYVFSQDVLDAGRKLFQQFKIIQSIIRNIYDRIMDEVNITVHDVLEDMGKNLQEFDNTWVAYEQIYVLELMLIEADARRFITEAIETEKELTALEQREKSRGRIVMDMPEYNSKRATLIQVLGKINSVANQEGMGRDDLSNDILLAAEGIFRRVSPHQSKAVRVLAERIKKSFMDFRNLLKKYEQNIEVVDPQLKNNNELVEILVEFENTWTQGLTYFMDHKKCHQLIHFSSVIEATGEKHKAFSEQLESREAEIFFIIPSLLILKSLEGDDKDICSFFNPDMFDKKTSQGQQLVALRKNYEEGREKMDSAFDYYNLIEKCILEVPLKDSEKKMEGEYDVQNKVIKEIKGLAMCLSRFKPADWNKFLDVVIK